MHLKLPDGHDSSIVRALLEGRAAFKVEEPVHAKRVYLDTFDGRLFDKALVLYRAGDELVLQSLDGDVRVRQASTGTPVHAAGLHSGAVRDRVEAVIKERALMQLAGISVRTTVYCILNLDEKTVARLVHTETSATTDNTAVTPAAYLSLLPVRGYSKHTLALAQELGAGETVASVEEELYRAAVSAAGQRIGGYSATLDVRLDPEMRSDAAAKLIMRRLLETIRVNEAGIRADIDVEFLHDYRVAIRRTRSALSQLKYVFPADVTERYQQGFRELGQRTNVLRDLDVYLQAEDGYRAMLPESMRDDIIPLFDTLRSQREQALASVIATLDDPETDRLLENWAAFLSEPGRDSEDAANAALPVVELSRDRITRIYRRILKRGERLTDSTQDAELHALRIEGKKLRYLLEFFASLYPKAELDALVRELKRLQENLGAFNDLSLQQTRLMTMAAMMPLADGKTAGALIATGALVQALASQQEQVRGEFAERFAAFASESNRQLYRDLFRRQVNRAGP